MNITSNKNNNFLHNKQTKFLHIVCAFVYYKNTEAFNPEENP